MMGAFIDVFFMLAAEPFSYLALLLIVSSIMVVTMKNLVRATLVLAFAMLLFALFYFQLGAGFVGMVQILLYTTAVAALLIFMIMLVKKDEKNRMVRPKTALLNRYTPLALTFFVGVLAVLMIAVLAFSDINAGSAKILPDDVIPLIGEAFLTQYVLPFEIVSLLLFIAALGAIIIARRKEPVAERKAGFDDEVSP